jgi:hypothetical protein
MALIFWAIVGSSLFSYYTEVRMLPPGTWVRPMWLAMVIGASCLMSIVLVLPCPLIGFYLTKGRSGMTDRLLCISSLVLSLFLFPASKMAVEHIDRITGMRPAL